MSISLLLLGIAKSEGESVIPMKPEGSYVHFQSFNDQDWEKHWIPTKATNYTGEWKVEESAQPQATPGEKILLMKTANAYYGISTKFDEPLALKDQTIVVQYEVRFQEDLNCGGAYLKLFSTENFEPESLTNESRYSIMFGPDKCGSTNKVHFIFRHENTKTHVIEEKHMKDAPSIKTDKINHLYTLIVRPDNSFEILIDGESVRQGNLLEDFAPAVNPPKMIDDPEDKKPEDWVDQEMMPDPEDKKPEDWNEDAPEFIPDPAKTEAPEGWLKDEPKFISDPSAVKPDDWDDELNGEWEAPTIPNPKCEKVGCGEYEAPLIPNPEYKGKWHPKMIKNPAYKGVWTPRQIPNPDYVEDLHPHNFMPIAGAGFELWMVNKEIGFNNIFIGTDEAAVHLWNKNHFIPKHKTQEAEKKKLEPKEGEKATGLLESFSEFVESIKDAYLNLYQQNAPMTIALTAMVAVLILVLLCLACCCRGSEKPEPMPKVPTARKATVTEVTEEEKKEEDEEKEEPAAQETAPAAEEDAPEAPVEEIKEEDKSPKVSKRKPKRGGPEGF